MYPLHVIKQIPSAGEAISRDRAITILEGTKVWFFAVAMHSVGFAFMSQKTSSRRKLQLHTSRDLAPVRFQMGIQMFTMSIS